MISVANSLRMMGARYVSRRFTHRDLHARTYLWLIEPDTWRGRNFSVDYVRRLCNFHHKFRCRFFASGHARFSQLVSLLPWSACCAKNRTTILRLSVIRHTIFATITYRSARQINISRTIFSFNSHVARILITCPSAAEISFSHYIIVLFT